MEIAITNKKVLKDPHLEIDFDLERGTVRIELTYTCAKCSGHGCGRHGGSGHCDERMTLTPDQIIPTLGQTGANAVELLLSAIKHQ